MGAIRAGEDLYESFSRIGKAVASPRRIQLLDLLCQGERSVEALAGAAGMSVANTSAHLGVLRGARLVERRRDGTRVLYRPAGDQVVRFALALEDLARDRLAEVDRSLRAAPWSATDAEPVTREELLRRMRRKAVVVIDVRPAEEYAAAHIPGAVSIPLASLGRRLRSLPRAAQIVAYCRGPYCILAPQAVAILRRKGFRARRLEDGFPEWRLGGLPVAAGAEASG
ncbi:MAG: metalloregulator ArsR/SmtB family transcription factor [Acidobacteria bacterium]|nr:metalloregulator ArsR/SmtB family transcription factor [Acidobacteriota bacterium]